MSQNVAVAGGWPSRWRGFSQHLSNPLLYVQILVLLFLCVLIIYPVFIIGRLSIVDDGGALTLDWFRDAYGNARNRTAIYNTIVMSLGTAAVAAVCGTFLGWAVARTDMPGRRMIELVAIIPFISTPFIGALAWVLLAGPSVGLLNQLWTYLGGGGSLINIYSMGGIIFVQALYEMPFVLLMVAGALRSMDPTLEEASLSSGAGTWKTMTKVTLPLVLPAILGSSLLVFVLSAEQFGVPAVLGTPARIRVLTTSIVESQASYPIRLGLGASLSVTLLGIALFGLMLQRYLLGKRSYTTVGGKGARPRVLSLGKLRWVIFGIAVAYMVLAVVLPYTAIFLSSIRTIWTADFQWSQWTLENYRWVIFDYPITGRAIYNSMFLAVVGATATMLLCALISFLTLRVKLPGRKFMDYLSIVPLGFPGVVLAFGLLHAWINPPFVLYGTIWIMFAAYMTRYLPIGVRSTSSSLLQIHPELEESSLSSGANWFQTFRNVTLPLLKPGIFAGWVLLFVAFSRELSASVLLYSPQQEVLSVAIYDLMQSGNLRALSALVFLQISICLVVVVAAKKLIGLDSSKGA